ncbi:MAG: Holliday junction branch migration protein RuvA [Candidatus Kerfeldbacteria bacterium]|nr:Holliday junction branch migration protein RuvA [Candidatus Kerfeldbacteria bacterium]
MIASLHGTIRLRESRAIVVSVGGIGWRVFVGSRVLKQAEGETVDLYTHLHVGGDGMDLYGFATPDELGLFESLIRVAGVGPKSALAILSETPSAEVRNAIISADTVPLMRASGIGKKTAERIILELSGTLLSNKISASDEAIDALERLGYTRREANEAMSQVDTSIRDVRERIRAALRTLSKRP